VMQLVQNDLKRTEAIAQASAYVVDVLTRYANIELHYNDDSIEDRAHLQDCTVKVYAAVLKYTLNVKMANESRAYRRRSLILC
jgi:hypothetical protein